MLAEEVAAAGFADVMQIGTGGFGSVFRARQPALHREVAVKVLLATVDGDGSRRFEREVVALGALSGHPHVVPVLSVGVTPGAHPFLVMPYYAAGSLADRLMLGPVPLDDAVEVARQIADALDAAHANGILHRDVKPANVLLTDWGTAVLGDFGIAAMAGAADTVSASVTVSAAYAAPEVLDGRPATVSSDVYGLGATLHHILTGAAAFARGRDEPLVAQYLRIGRDRPPDLRLSGIPDRVAVAVERAMSKRPEDRPTSAAELVAELTGGGARHAAPDTAATSSRRRRRTALASAAVVAIVVAAIITAAVWRRSQDAQRAGVAPRDVTPGGDALVLATAPTAIPLEVAADTAVDVRFAGQAGERVIGDVERTESGDPVPVAILFDGSPAEASTLNGRRVELDPVVLDESGQWTFEIGPSPTAFAGIAHLGLAPPDATAEVAVGEHVDVALTSPRQRAMISVDVAEAGSLTVDWVWDGPDPQSASLSLQAPDGDILTSWGALASGKSDPTAVAVPGTYRVVATLDGDGTGSATVSVEAS